MFASDLSPVVLPIFAAGAAIQRGVGIAVETVAGRTGDEREPEARGGRTASRHRDTHPAAGKARRTLRGAGGGPGGPERTPVRTASSSSDVLHVIFRLRTTTRELKKRHRSNCFRIELFKASYLYIIVSLRKHADVW